MKSLFPTFIVYCVGVSLVTLAPKVHAQSIRDMVNDTVDEGLEKEKAKKEAKEEKKAEEEKKEEPKTESKSKPKPSDSPKASSKPAKSKPSNSKPSKGKAHTYTYDSNAPPEEVDPKDKLPKRVMNKYILLDPQVGAAYRGWYPQQYPTLKSKMASYFTWSVDLKGRFFKYVSLKRGYYESNGLASPRHPNKTDAAKYGKYASKAAWFLMELGIPIMKAWEPTIRYEARAFRTNAKTTGDNEVCIVKYTDDADDVCTDYDTDFSMVSSFETAVLGVTYYPSKNPSAVIADTDGKKPPFFFGLGYLSYVKPYQVTIGSTVLEELLFTGRFYGGGLAFGTKIGGGINKPFLDIWTQFGLGATRLTKDLTLNDAAPADWLIGYIQGNVKFAFRWAPWKFAPTLLICPSVEASGATFFFFETKRKEGEEFVMPNVNWDILYTAKLSIILTL